MIVAHGGTVGLILEIVPLVLVVVGGIAVWWRSRGADSGGTGTGDEPAVEE
jgi:hypothetical protein